MATFNRSHLIIETLESIQNQTYPHFKCFITDDRSEDSTKDIVEQFCRNDARFEYFLKPDTYKNGLSDTRNFGLDLAEQDNADFIQFFDDDDIMHREMLEMKLRPLLRDQTLDFSLCQFRKFWTKEVIELEALVSNDGYCNVHSFNLLEDFYFNKLDLNSPGPLWKADALNGYRFNKELSYAEEKEFYLRLFLDKDLKHAPVPQILFWYRKHPNAITSGLYADDSIKLKSARNADLYFLQNLLNNGDVNKKILLNYFIKIILTDDIEIRDTIVNHFSNGRKKKHFLFYALFKTLELKVLFFSYRSAFNLLRNTKSIFH